MAPGCVTMYGDRYGQWRPFDPDEVHRGDTFGAPRAIMVLEAQDKLMTILRDITFTILEDKSIPLDLGMTMDLDGTLKTRKRWEKLLGTAPRKSPHEPYFEVGALEYGQYYSAPPDFDIDTFHELIQLKIAAAEDHLRALQVDPAYFYERAREEQYRTGGSAITVDELPLGGELLNRLTYGPFLDVMLWKHLLWHCVRVQKQYRKHQTEILPGHSLPYNYIFAVRDLGWALQWAHVMLSDRLQVDFFSAASLRYLISIHEGQYVLIRYR